MVHVDNLDLLKVGNVNFLEDRVNPSFEVDSGSMEEEPDQHMYYGLMQE